jgi:hypothetical protein
VLETLNSISNHYRLFMSADPEWTKHMKIWPAGRAERIETIRCCMHIWTCDDDVCVAGLLIYQTAIILLITILRVSTWVTVP